MPLPAWLSVHVKFYIYCVTVVQVSIQSLMTNATGISTVMSKVV